MFPLCELIRLFRACTCGTGTVLYVSIPNYYFEPTSDKNLASSTYLYSVCPYPPRIICMLLCQNLQCVLISKWRWQFVPNLFRSMFGHFNRSNSFSSHVHLSTIIPPLCDHELGVDYTRGRRPRVPCGYLIRCLRFPNPVYCTPFNGVRFGIV